MTVRIPPNTRDEVRDRARRLGVKEAQYVRAAIEVALGTRCCVGTLFTGSRDPFHAYACQCRFNEKSVGN